jgi:hypothetical protein
LGHKSALAEMNKIIERKKEALAKWQKKNLMIG